MSWHLLSNDVVFRGLDHEREEEEEEQEKEEEQPKEKGPQKRKKPKEGKNTCTFVKIYRPSPGRWKGKW